MPENEWIEFVQGLRKSGKKTDIWVVLAKKNGSILGTVQFFGAWRKYVFAPKGALKPIFDANCMRAIGDFCEEQTKAWRKSLA